MQPLLYNPPWTEQPKNLQEVSLFWKQKPHPSSAAFSSKSELNLTEMNMLHNINKCLCRNILLGVSACIWVSREITKCVFSFNQEVSDNIVWFLFDDLDKNDLNQSQQDPQQAACLWRNLRDPLKFFCGVIKPGQTPGDQASSKMDTFIFRCETLSLKWTFERFLCIFNSVLKVQAGQQAAGKALSDSISRFGSGSAEFDIFDMKMRRLTPHNSAAQQDSGA